MSTKTIKVDWGAATGYADSEELSFTSGEITELREILGRWPEGMTVELERAARAIWMYKYTETPPASEISVALNEVAAHADQLSSRLLDPSASLSEHARNRLISAYMGINPNDVPIEHVPGMKSRRSARLQFQKDVAALERLSLNLTIAAKSARPPRNRPFNHLIRYAIRRLVETYEKVVGTTFPETPRKGGKASHAFIRAAVRMLLKAEPQTVARPLKDFLDKRRAQRGET